ncbi:hypothetical protein CF336_g4558 [Tilletia laevis]|nr:hypothetical protein CF336_g4558 [Tilletia laevis]KAE8201241.1 hypothetical protein CF335_g3787 [Tilletia laevis]
MKSISSFMLIGMLFAISGVNTSDVINKCSDLAVHCKTLGQVKFTVFSCTCTIWTLSGKGDCYKGCMADHHDPGLDVPRFCKDNCDNFRQRLPRGCGSIPQECHQD